MPVLGTKAVGTLGSIVAFLIAPTPSSPSAALVSIDAQPIIVTEPRERHVTRDLESKGTRSSCACPFVGMAIAVARSYGRTSMAVAVGGPKVLPTCLAVDTCHNASCALALASPSSVVAVLRT